MIPTPTDEIRAARRELAARFGNDLHRIAQETRRRQQESGRTYVSLPACPPQVEGTPPSATADRDGHISFWGFIARLAAQTSELGRSTAKGGHRVELLALSDTAEESEYWMPIAVCEPEPATAVPKKVSCHDRS
jgi:hypothetical protein